MERLAPTSLAVSTAGKHAIRYLNLVPYSKIERRAWLCYHVRTLQFVTRLCDSRCVLLYNRRNDLEIGKLYAPPKLCGLSHLYDYIVCVWLYICVEYVLLLSFPLTSIYMIRAD
jgi:hypothetical protein